MSAGVFEANSLSRTASFFRSCEDAAPDRAAENFCPSSASALQLPADVRPERSSPDSVVVASVVTASSVVVASSVVTASSVVVASVVATSSVVAAAVLSLSPPQPAATTTTMASTLSPRARVIFLRIGLLRFRVSVGVGRAYGKAGGGCNFRRSGECGDEALADQPHHLEIGVVQVLQVDTLDAHGAILGQPFEHVVDRAHQL